MIRKGGRADVSLIATISAFLALAGLVILAARRQQAREEAAIEEYAARHGWAIRPDSEAEIVAILQRFEPETRWSARYPLPIEEAPSESWLFKSIANRPRQKSASRRFACLARHAGPQPVEPVAISHRVPLVEKLGGRHLDVGATDFAKEFLVDGEQPGVAAQLIDERVQRILLAHQAGPGWVIGVSFVGPWLLVDSSWATGPAEWDHLREITLQMRDALDTSD